MSDSVPFVSLSEGTGTEAGTVDCVMSDAIPFVSLSAGTEAEIERPAPQAPPIPPPAVPHIFFLTSWASRSSPPAPASDRFSTMDSVSVTTR